MNIIGLTKGMVTIVSEIDYTYLMVFGSWRASKSAVNHYAKTEKTEFGYSIGYYMHRVIMERMIEGEIPKGMEVDHINHNSLDNRRENLRLVTKQENNRNRRNWK